MQQALPAPTRPRSGVVGWLTETSYAGAARRKALLAYLFLLPTILGIVIFTAGPVLASLTLSLFNWDVISPPTFAGLSNYGQLANDHQVVLSFGNTFIFVILDVTLQIVVGLALALAMQRKMARWLRTLFRGIFFLPLITSGVAVAIVMAYLFNKDQGVIDYYLGLVGIPHIPWITSTSTAMISVVLASVWQQMGFTFLIFIGGLANISTEVLEAADMDGAAGWRRLWHITLPLVSPSLMFVAVVGIIDALQVFATPYIMTGGGPGDATRTVVMIIYQAAFQNLQIGYGSAIAVLLFAVILLVTAVQFFLSKRWVFYQ
jgi:multiple sugar transport system permease protein